MNSKKQIEAMVTLRPQERTKYPAALAKAATLALLEYNNGEGAMQDGLGLVIMAYLTNRGHTMEAING